MAELLARSAPLTFISITASASKAASTFFSSSHSANEETYHRGSAPKNSSNSIVTKKEMDERETMRYICQLSRYSRLLDLSGCKVNTHVVKLLVASCPYLEDLTLRDVVLTRRRLRPLKRLGYLSHFRLRGYCQMDFDAWDELRASFSFLQKDPKSECDPFRPSERTIVPRW